MRGLRGARSFAARRGPPRPSGTPPEGGELGRGRDFPRGRRDGAGEEMGLSGIRSGHHPLPPPPAGGRGRSRTGLPSEEEIPGKTTTTPCTYPAKSREIPSRKFTIPPRLVNGFFISNCKPARKKFPKNLDKGGLGLYLCRWENGCPQRRAVARLHVNPSDQKNKNIHQKQKER